MQLNDCEYLFHSQVQYDKIHIVKHSNKAFLTKDFRDNRTVFQNLLDKRNSIQKDVGRIHAESTSF